MAHIDGCGNFSQMNKIAVLSAFLLLCGALSWASSADAASARRVAVVNLERAIYTTREAKQRIEKLRKSADYVDQKKKVDSLQEKGRKLVEKFRKDSSTMSDGAKRRAERKINALSSDVEYEVKKLQGMEQNVLQDLKEEMTPRAREALDELVKEEEIGLLLRDAPQVQLVLFAVGEYDVTSQLTDRLNRSR